MNKPKNAKVNGWVGTLRTHPFLLFLVLFFIYLLTLQLITHVSWIIQPLTVLTTSLTTMVLKWIGLPVSMEGSHILSARNINMEIIYECTGIYGIIVYTSAVLASDASWIQRLQGLWIGLPIIWLMNLLRLVTIYWVSYEYPPLFDFMHTYFWQLFLIIVVIFIYYSWYRRVQKHDQAKLAS